MATDIDSENGPMTLLARNVTENCGLAAATSRADSHRPSLRDPVGLGSRDIERASELQEEEEPRTSPSDTNFSSPPRVQSLRWGDRAQLARALANFEGFGPDVVLA